MAIMNSEFSWKALLSSEAELTSVLGNDFNLLEIRTPRSLEPSEVKNWVERACELLRVSPTAMARQADIASSTLNRFLSGKAKNLNLSANTINRLSEVIASLIEAQAIQKSGQKFEVSKTIEVPVKMSIHANVFKKKPWLEIEEQLKIVVPFHHSLFGLRAAAFLVENGVSNLYPSGSVVIGRVIPSVVPEVEDGSHVVFMRRKSMGIETLIHEVIVDPKHRRWLRPLGDTSQSQGMILLGEPNSELPDDLAMIADVVCSYRAPL